MPVAKRDSAWSLIQEHGREIRTYLGMSSFGLTDFRRLVEDVATIAAQADKGLLRARKVALPGITVIERACAQALTRANRGIYTTLGEQLTVDGRKRLDGLLRRRPDSFLTEIGWLRQAPSRPNARAMREHIDRLTASIKPGTIHALDTLTKATTFQQHLKHSIPDSGRRTREKRLLPQPESERFHLRRPKNALMTQQPKLVMASDVV